MEDEIHRPLVFVLEVDAFQRPQRAISGIGASVDHEIGAAAEGEVAGVGAGLPTGGAGVIGIPASDRIPVIIGADIAADPDAGVGAGDVIESLAVEAADLHVFDRLGLDRQIGRLRTAGCKQACGAEEQALHSVHLKPPSCSVTGRAPSVASTLWKATPRKPSGF